MSASAAKTSSSQTGRSSASAPPARSPVGPVQGDAEDRREEERELLYGETVETLRAIAATQRLTQHELARRLGVSDARMSRIMSGRENLTLRTLSDVGWAIGIRFEVAAVPLQDRAGTPAEDDPPAPRWLRQHSALIARRVRDALR